MGIVLSHRERQPAINRVELGVFLLFSRYQLQSDEKARRQASEGQEGVKGEY